MGRVMGRELDRLGRVWRNRMGGKCEEVGRAELE